jgi:AraC family transcriptional regulator
VTEECDRCPHLRGSRVYRTQVCQQAEGLALYRYQLRRLARALELLPQYDDVTSLSPDLGFYSHSHFSTAFAKVYGYSVESRPGAPIFSIQWCLHP